MNVLEVVNLKYSYDTEKTVLNNISFTLKSGEILVILGPNGTGKSTLLKNICHILIPQEGYIAFNGKKNITTLFTNRKQSIIYGYIPQIQKFIPNIKAKEYAVLGRSASIGLFSQPNIGDYNLVKEIFESLKITYLYDKNYEKLSGGEQQLVRLAKVLCQQPSILLLDESTSQLDYGNQIRFLKIVKQLAEMGYIIILTTHDPNHALYLECYVGILNFTGGFKVDMASNLLNGELLTELYKTPVNVEYNHTLQRLVCNAI